jgi:hypothetical protein
MKLSEKSRVRSMLKTLTAIVPALLIVASLCSGCSDSSDAGKLASIKQAVSSQQEIIAKSGGKWENLSQADQQVLINGPGYGNADAAKSYLASSYQRLSYKPVIGPPANIPKPPSQ